MDFPSCLIQDSKFFRKDPRFCIQLFNFIIPGEEDSYFSEDQDFCPLTRPKPWMMVTHEDGMAARESMREVYKKYLGGTTLRLLYKASTGTTEVIKDVVIKDETRARARFSYDSQFVAIFMKNLNVLKLYRIGADELPEIRVSARSEGHGKHPLTKAFSDIEKDRYFKKHT